MTINVTAEHIAQGSPESPWSCPIALALREQLGLRDVGVCPYYIRVHRGDSKYSDYYDTPREATDFLNAFDNNAHVEPFSFEFPPVKKTVLIVDSNE